MKKSLMLLTAFVALMNNAYSQDPGGYGKDSLPDCRAVFQFYYNDSIKTFVEAYPYQFNDLSTGEVTKRSWDFGDGSTSGELNPLHFYDHYGDTVTACLTISTGAGCQSHFCRTFVVGDPMAQPLCDANFYYFHDSTLSGQFYRFQEPYDNDNIQSYWDFGDGTTSYEMNPMHRFSGSDIYIVCHTRTKSDGQVCTSYQQVFTGWDTIAGDCITTFDIQTLESYPPQYRFVPLTSDSIEWYYWDFGDGLQTYEYSPVHRYDYSGFCTACLITKTISGCKSNYCLTFYAEGQTTDCQAYWEGYPADPWVLSSSMPPDSFPHAISNSFIFHDQSRGRPVSWHWTFGDGTDSYEQHPFHSYAEAGIYTVCLEILTADSCTSQFCDSIYAGIQEVPVCEAYFWHYALPWVSSLPPIYQFESDSSQGIVSWQWDMGDGRVVNEKSPVHRYEYSGYYTICLTTVSPDGYSASCCETSYFEGRHPQPGLCNYRLSILTEMVVGSIHTCDGSASVSLIDAFGNKVDVQSCSWSTGSGETYVDELCSNADYQVTVVDPDGCLITGSFVFSGGGYMPADTLWGNWKYEKDGMDFVFSLPLFSAGYSCVWELGDGTTLEGSDVIHTYNEKGEYIVTLNVYDTEGNIAYTRQIAVDTDAPTGTQDLSGERISSVYPVPAKDQLFITLVSTDSRTETVEVYNTSGEKVLIKEINLPEGTATVTLDVTDLPAGVYQGLIKSGNFGNPFRFIK